jgi:hypothetical protein
MMNYGYTYRNGPLVRWGHGTPVQTKAADAQSLGSLEESSLTRPTLYGSSILPAPGAPEPIGVSNQRMSMGGVMEAMGGCSCTGTCGCSAPAATTPLSDISDAVPGGWVTIGVGAFLVWHFMKKRRR